MVRRLVISLVAAALCLPATAQAADAPPTQHSAGVAACTTPPGELPVKLPKFMPWGRDVTFEATFYGDWYETWENGVLDYSSEGSEDFVWASETGKTTMPLNLRWKGSIESCYWEQALSVPAGRGAVPKFTLRKQTDWYGEYRDAFDFMAISSSTSRLDADADKYEPNCDTVRFGAGTVMARRGKGRWYKRSVADLCTLFAKNGKAMSLGKGLKIQFRGAQSYDDSDSVEVGEAFGPTVGPIIIRPALAGPAKETVTVKFVGSGQAFAKRVQITRVDRPDRKIWTGTDEYWNYCVNEAQEVYAEGGNYYCWKYGSDRVRMKLLR